MKIVNINPNLSENEIKQKQQDAARLFLNVYKTHEKNKRAKLVHTDSSSTKDSN